MKKNITLFFPVYNDEKTVEIVARKAEKFLQDVADEYEILIIDDGSPDRSGKIADELATKMDNLKVIHHPKNLGYGTALKTGFKNSRYELICFTDGDNEYDVYDFYKLIKLVDYYDLIITFRYKRLYSKMRIIISRVYNSVLRLVFRTYYRDISTGLRLIKKNILEDIDLESDSPFIGAELTIKTMLKGYRVGEVGIQTFPRKFNTGSSTTIKNILHTIKDIWRIHKSIFSSDYDPPIKKD